MHLLPCNNTQTAPTIHARSGAPPPRHSRNIQHVHRPSLRTPLVLPTHGCHALQFLLMGTMNDRGILTSRATWRASDALTAKYESRISPTDYGSPMYMVDVEYTGADWNGQLKTGMNGFYGANYMQSIMPWLAAGGEIFYLAEQGRSGVGFAARVSDEKSVGTLQVCAWTPHAFRDLEQRRSGWLPWRRG